MLNGADLKVCLSRDEDDEEALRWAALEKLPTYDRARTAVLSMPEGELKEVNADKLGAQQRIASVGDDHECFLSKFKDRVDRYAPQLELLTSSLESLSQVGIRKILCLHVNNSNNCPTSQI
ncbi:Pleiotropic drug resistance protein 4 [Hordeum vulgare]|nr:Pleiotropic drug resistance protein 4 [Hordeum vulgare]